MSKRISIVNLADARTLADELWNGGVEAGAQWSSRKAHIEKLHTLCYQLLVELAGRNVRTVAINADGQGGVR